MRANRITFNTKGKELQLRSAAMAAPSLSDHIDLTIKRLLYESLLTFQNNDRSNALIRPPSHEKLVKLLHPLTSMAAS